ncbi:MAG TPA: amino acid permease [Acholeplasmataceae bacterium]|nr:amino acid permease [Acholeplasmataceae bacterium]
MISLLWGDEMTSLKKEISLFGGISILAGIMIGSGIFVFGSLILVRVGYSLVLSLIAWLLGGIITMFSGLTYAELGTMFPETGGYYVYLKKAYGKKVAFLSGMMNFVLSSSGSIALLALIFAEILSYVLPISSYIKLIAAGMIILLSAINFFGIKFGALVQKIFLVAKVIPIVAIIIIGLFMGTESVNLSFSGAGDVGFFKLLTMIGFGVVGTLWAYEGWTNLNTVAGEMKNAKKDLPKAIVIAIGLVGLLYVLFIFSIYRIISETNLVSLAASGTVLPIAAMMTLFGETGMIFVFVAVMISVFGALNGSIMVFPRVYYAMAEDKTFIKSFSKLHPKYQTPYISIIGSGLMALLLLFFNIEELLTFVVFGGLIFNTLIFISIFIFRKKNKDLDRPYKVWGYPYVPIIAVIGMLSLLVATLIESFVPSMIGFGVLIVGYVLYQVFMKEK